MQPFTQVRLRRKTWVGVARNKRLVDKLIVWMRWQLKLNVKWSIMKYLQRIMSLVSIQICSFHLLGPLEIFVVQSWNKLLTKQKMCITAIQGYSDTAIQFWKWKVFRIKIARYILLTKILSDLRGSSFMHERLMEFPGSGFWNAAAALVRIAERIHSAKPSHSTKFQNKPLRFSITF